MKCRDEDVISFLRENGLLGEINRCVLHPRGLGLASKIGSDGVETLVLYETSDDAGLQFDNEILHIIERKLKDYDQYKSCVDRNKRLIKYGGIIQKYEIGNTDK